MAGATRTGAQLPIIYAPTTPHDLHNHRLRSAARAASPFADGPPPDAAARLGRKLGLAAFAALSGALAFSLLTDAGRQTRDAMSLLPEADQVLFWTGLRLDQVALSGQRFTSDSDIFDALDLANARSLLSFHSTAARRRIEALPWIETASITREIPGALDIRVTERKPTALWLHEGREILIDSPAACSPP